MEPKRRKNPSSNAASSSSSVAHDSNNASSGGILGRQKSPSAHIFTCCFVSNDVSRAIIRRWRNSGPEMFSSFQISLLVIARSRFWTRLLLREKEKQTALQHGEFMARSSGLNCVLRRTLNLIWGVICPNFKCSFAILWGSFGRKLQLRRMQFSLSTLTETFLTEFWRHISNGTFWGSHFRLSSVPRNV